MGYFIYRATGETLGHTRWSTFALYCFGANAPDLDFIPGLLVGDPERYHHGPSHSIGFAIVFSLALGFLAAVFRLGDGMRKFIIFFSLYFSHVAVDCLSMDTSAPYGVPLLWPLSAEYYMAPFAFLPDIHRTAASTIVEFIASVFSLHNLWAATVESLMFLPLFILMVVRRPARSLPAGGARRPIKVP
jgi:inner membrane protein